MQRTEAAVEQVVDEGLTLANATGSKRLALIAAHSGDLTPFLSGEQLATISAQCVRDYEQDCTDREDWETKAKEALKRAKQEPDPEKTWPWKGASNASFPLLTTAALQFASRALGAIVKGDEVVSCKVVGSDKGLPMVGPDGAPLMQVGPEGPTPVWQRPPGAKQSRADRVREYMNYVIFYRMKGWESDMDLLLHQLPIIGCGFKKVFVDGPGQRSDFVSALKLVAPMDAKSCEQAPRLTEVRDNLPLNDVIGLQRAGFYRDVTLVEQEESHGLRTLLEQHCLLDLDEDGYAEPYVVTLDDETHEVLRVEPTFGPQDIVRNEAGEVVSIRRLCFYVKFDFFPNLDGGFYGLGLGHLLDNIGRIVNNTINQMIDSGTAAAAGGGFIGSGVDLSSAGKRSSHISMMPGTYKTVTVGGSSLRDAIYERTYPGPNPVTFQVLDLMLGAAREISSTKDVLTGDASNNGQVGTTMALIEQGLQLFTSIYKRIYRSLKDEFSTLFANIGMYGGPVAQEDYVSVLDDPTADLAADFNADDFDIRPVSDPTSVTRMQKMGRAQFLGQFLSAPGMNPQEIIRRMLEAADVDDIDSLFVPPSGPDPMMIAAQQAEIAKLEAAGQKDQALALKAQVDAQVAVAKEQREQEQAALQAISEGFRAGAMG
jgi:chaperonin GroES